MDNETDRAEIDDDPWFRTETRVPECGSPYPEGLRDPLSPTLLDAARDLWRWVVFLYWGPATLANFPGLQQWKKFELLDWLRPLELLLRHLLLIEALGLCASQSLPPARSPGVSSKGKKRTARLVALDPDRPETWRVSFNAQSPGGPSRKLPPVPPTGCSVIRSGPSATGASFTTPCRWPAGWRR